MEDRKNALLQQAADALRPKQNGKTSSIDKDALDSALKELASLENLDSRQTASQIARLVESRPSPWRRLRPLWRLLVWVGLAVVAIGLVAVLSFVSFRLLAQPQLDELKNGLEQAQAQISDQEEVLGELKHASELATARAQEVHDELQSLSAEIDGLNSKLESMVPISPPPAPTEPTGIESSPSPPVEPGTPKTPEPTATPMPSALESEQPIAATMTSGGPWKVRTVPAAEDPILATVPGGYKLDLFGQFTEGLWRLGCCYEEQFFWAGRQGARLLIQTNTAQDRIPWILMPAPGEVSGDEWETDVLDGLQSHYRSVTETPNLTVRWSLDKPGPGEIVVEAWVPSDWSTAVVTYAVSELVAGANSETRLEPVQGTGSLDQSTLAGKPGFFPIGRYQPSDGAGTIVIRLVTASPGAQAPAEGAHVAFGPLRIVSVEGE